MPVHVDPARPPARPAPGGRASRLLAVTVATLLLGAVAGPLAPAAPVAAAAAGAEPLAPSVEPSVVRVPLVGAGVRTVDRAAAASAAASGPLPLVAARTLTPDAPFTLLGVTWDAPYDGTGLQVRARVREDGRWTPWTTLAVGDAGPDVGTPEARRARPGTEPLLSGSADAAQVVVRSAGRPPAGLDVQLVDPGRSTADARVAAPTAAAAGEPAALRASTTAASTVPVAGAAPPVVTRAGWGADESLRGEVTYNQTLRAAVVHHTATSSSYTREQAAAQVRAIYAYHTVSHGWSDIGYHFLVDRFGTVYEGRAGSMDRLVLGAHAGGFNTDTLGVSALGNYDASATSRAMNTSIAEVVAWKLGQYDVDPAGTTRLTSRGGGTARYPAGTTITVPAVTMHRTVGLTSCPGRFLAAQLPAIRSLAASLAARDLPQAGAFPLAGDWDGTGRSRPGWFRSGTWSLSRADGSVARFAFGTRGDLPVVGDWNGDGRDEIGVFRSGDFHLRAHLDAGPASVSTRYGRAGDLPVVGRWPGASQDSLGVVRGSTWYLRDGLTGARTLGETTYGVVGDTPVVGDWDGNGTTTIGVVRAPNTWLLSNSATPRTGEVATSFGSATDVALPGDWDGDGRSTPGAVRGVTFWFRDTLSAGPAHGNHRFAG